MRKFVAALFAVLVIAVVAAGCGGGGDSTGSSSTADTGSSSTESESTTGNEKEAGEEEESGAEGSSGGAAPTKAAFIKEADAVCSTAELELSEEVIAFAKNGIDIEKEEEPSDDQKTEIYEQIVLPNITRQAEELSELTPPKGDEGTIEELTSKLSDEAESAEEDPSNLDENTFKDASKIAQDYGLHSCGA